MRHTAPLSNAAIAAVVSLLLCACGEGKSPSAENAQADINKDAAKTTLVIAPAYDDEVYSSMSRFERTITLQLGAKAAHKLQSAMTSMERQTDRSDLTADGIETLKTVLTNGDVTQSLDFIEQLALQTNTVGLNQVDLRDIVSISTASILADTFGSKRPKPIHQAIEEFSSTDPLGGARKLVEALNGSTVMTKQQEGVVNELLDGLEPMLGEAGRLLDMERRQRDSSSKLYQP
ncbi:hypothetical protein [Cerasicoccus frondis]|uniref:hypothetical protein n=1 Tax=Cerasicoccus frondis TaxID=490090 RepID=UPI0028527EEA|nr:hypothetical protein [Cerasicoccus frondis]